MVYKNISYTISGIQQKGSCGSKLAEGVALGPSRGTRLGGQRAARKGPGVRGRPALLDYTDIHISTLNSGGLYGNNRIMRGKPGRL